MSGVINMMRQTVQFELTATAIRFLCGVPESESSWGSAMVETARAW